MNLLIAGFEKEKGPVLYWMDYLAAMQPMPFALHGYGAFFCLGLLDKLYKPSMLYKCLHTIFVKYWPHFHVFAGSEVAFLRSHMSRA